MVYVTVLQALFIMVAGGFGMVIPAQAGLVPTSGRSGFMALGFGKALGLAVANIIWFTQTAMIAMGGIAYIYLLVYRLRKTAHDTQGNAH